MTEFKRRRAVLSATAGAAIATLAIAGSAAAASASTSLRHGAYPATATAIAKHNPGPRPLPPPPPRPRPRPLPPWRVSLTSSRSVLAPGQFATLVANANRDVTHTALFVRIYDETNHAYIATCGGGRKCVALVHWNGPVGLIRPNKLRTPPSTYDYYEALVSGGSGAYPPGNIRATAFARITMLGHFIPLPPAPGPAPRRGPHA